MITSVSGTLAEREGEAVVIHTDGGLGYEVTVRAYPSAALTDTDGKVDSAKKWYSSLAA